MRSAANGRRSGADWDGSASSTGCQGRSAAKILGKDIHDTARLSLHAIATAAVASMACTPYRAAPTAKHHRRAGPRRSRWPR